MDAVRRGIALVSLGSLTLVVMATLVKYLGERLPAMEIFFFRSMIGFVLVLRGARGAIRSSRCAPNGPACISCAAPWAPSATPASSGR